MRPRNLICRTVWIVPLLVCSMWLLASASATPDADEPPQFGPWSAPVNLGPPVNSVNADYQPFIAKDGLSLYFTYLPSNVAGGQQDIYVSKRASKDDPWGTPQKLGPAINSGVVKGNAFVTIDGHYMFFNANRADSIGRADIYVSRRPNKREDLPTDPSGGWQEPVNLGPGVNTAFVEQAPFVFEDEVTGVTTLYFNSNRTGNNDIYASTLQPDGTFGPAVPVTELNTPATEQNPTLSRDGLEIYFISDRPGSSVGLDGPPSLDIWVSTRASTSDPWGVPENLDAVNARLGGRPINSPFHDGRPSLSFDGRTLYFFSAFRVGNQSAFFDIWVTTRTKLKELEDDKSKD